MDLLGKVSVDVRISSEDVRAGLERDVRAGFTTSPKTLPPVWFYDDRGSELFDRITRLPEYYLTRCERFLIEGHAHDVASMARAEVLVELGAGTCDKTQVILDALLSAGDLRRYVPLDVSEGTLRGAVAELAKRYPDLEIAGLVADFQRGLAVLPSGGRRLVAFLGSTIGNFGSEQRHGFFGDLSACLVTGDTFLLGVDLVKDRERLVAAYSDHGGVTAEFNRNVLLVVNRELGADFDPSLFEHRALFNEAEQCIEMRLRATADHVVAIRSLGMEIHFDAGEELLTETSAKFTVGGISAELSDAGISVDAVWESPGAEYALVMCQL